MQDKPDREQLNIRLSTPMATRMDEAIARGYAVSRTELARHAIVEYLERRGIMELEGENTPQ